MAATPPPELLLAIDTYLDDCRAGRSDLAPPPVGDLELADELREMAALIDRLVALPADDWAAAGASPTPATPPAPALTSAPSPVSPPPVPLLAGGGRPVPLTTAGRRHVLRRRPAVAAAAAVVVAVALAGIGLTLPSPSPSPSPRATPTWRLAGYVGTPAWQAHATPGGPSFLSVTCASPTWCVATDQGTDAGHGGVEVTDDFGRQWSAATLPAGVTLTSPASCSQPGDCAIGAQLAGGGSAVLVTTDGTTYSSWSLPTGTGPVAGVQCSTVTACIAVAGASASGPATGVVTTDGGMTWRAAALPAGFEPEPGAGLACSAPGQCTSAGSLSPSASATSQAAAAVTTDDGGTWSLAAFPPGRQVDAISCAAVGFCAALYQTQTPAVGSAVTSAGGASALAVSRDGGLTFAAAADEGLPPALLRSVSCAGADRCWVAGTGLNGGNGNDTPVVLATGDGGATFTDQPLPTGANLLLVAALSCRGTASCMGLAPTLLPGQTTGPVAVLANTGP